VNKLVWESYFSYIRTNFDLYFKVIMTIWIKQIVTNGCSGLFHTDHVQVMLPCLVSLFTNTACSHMAELVDKLQLVHTWLKLD
jgi:hypothetical protein